MFETDRRAARPMEARRPLLRSPAVNRARLVAINAMISHLAECGIHRREGHNLVDVLARTTGK